MSILFYAPTSIGLGHVSRSLAIAEAIRAQQPDIPIIVGSEVPDTRLLQAYTYPYYVLPAADAITFSARWKSPEINAAAWHAHFGMFRSLLEVHQPSLLVFDTFIERELYEISRDFELKTVVVMRNRPDLMDVLSRGHEIYEDVDLIVFPHDEYEVDEPDLPWVIDMDKVMYSGPCVRPLPTDKQIEAVQATYHLAPDRFTILVTNGGGISPLLLKSDYDYYLETVIDAVQAIDADLLPYHLIVISGPLHAYPVPRPKLRNGLLTVKQFEPHMMALYANSQMAITRGGYNTRSELARVGILSLSIPLRRSQDNQSLQLRTLAQRTPNIQVGSLEKQAISEAILKQAQQARWVYQWQPLPVTRLSREVVPKLLELAGVL